MPDSGICDEELLRMRIGSRGHEVTTSVCQAVRACHHCVSGIQFISRLKAAESDRICDKWGFLTLVLGCGVMQPLASFSDGFATHSVLLLVSPLRGQTAARRQAETQPQTRCLNLGVAYSLQLASQY